MKISHVLTLRSHTFTSCHFPLYLLYFVHEPQSLSSFVNCCDFRDDAERLYQFWYTPGMPILRHSCRLATLHFSRLTLPFSFLLAVSRHKKRAPLNADAPKVKISDKFQLRSHLKMTFSLVKYGFSQSLPPHPALSHDSQICCLLTIAISNSTISDDTLSGQIVINQNTFLNLK